MACEDNSVIDVFLDLPCVEKNEDKKGHCVQLKGTNLLYFLKEYKILNRLQQTLYEPTQKHRLQVVSQR